MPIDRAWLKDLLASPELATQDKFVIDDVEILLPVSNARGGKQRLRDWQRRVLPDILPDSVNADAPERTPFKILYALTSNQRTKVGIEEALSGNLAPLEPLFRAETATNGQSARKKMTLAFHVLAIKAAASGEPEVKGFSERTFTLLCRRPDGRMNHPLVERLVNEFRRDPSTLDLAQRTLLEAIEPGWTQAREPTFDANAGADVVVPFDPSVCALFQEDLGSLLDAGMSSSDFFQHLNLLLILHMGLFQPRAAVLLNPQMRILEQDLSAPSRQNVVKLGAFLEDAARRHPFAGFIDTWAADDGRTRKISSHTPALESFERVDRELQRFHFALLTLVQLRRLAEAYLAHRWEVRDEYFADKLDADTRANLQAEVQTPAKLLARMHDDPAFRHYLERALTVLCVRFLHIQLDEPMNHPVDVLHEAASPLEGLRRLYERYNTQNSRNATASRAYRQGTQVVSSLLSQGEYGLVQSRRGIGRYFEIGAGLLPLLLLLTVTPSREKVPVDRFWERLERYGLALDTSERGRLLERFRAMGVYERYSDAGDSAYVRNLVISASAA